MAHEQGAGGDPVLEAMRRELERSMTGLRVPGTPRPHYLAYTVCRRQLLKLRGAHGSLARAEESRRCSLYVDLRVGSHHFDNVVDAGLTSDMLERESAEWLEGPYDLEPMALRVALWKLTQIKFDEAVEDYYDHRKAMVTEYLRDEIDSFTREPTLVHLEELHEEGFPRADWEQALVEATRRFLAEPDIHDPGITLQAERRHRWLVNSEGTKVRTEEVYVEVFVNGWVLADDGVYLEATRECYVRSLAGVPDRARLEALVDETIAELRELRNSVSPGAFIGPALLAGQAASTVFHEALGHRLEGSRLVARGETRTFANKRGTRILPAGLSVYDDPTLTTFAAQDLWGSYRVDDEGVAAQRTKLVDDGVLVDFLRSRTPIPGADGRSASTRSSGHGRHDGVQASMARMGNLVVECEPGAQRSREDLERELLALARAQGRSEAAVISRIRAGETSTSSYDFQVFKGEIARMHIIDVATGTRRRVRDLELIGTPLAALQRIVGFGGEPETDQGYCFAESGSIPVGGIAPALLLSEVELQQRNSTSFHDPLLPPPYADDGSRGRTGNLRERGRRRRRS